MIYDEINHLNTNNTLKFILNSLIFDTCRVCSIIWGVSISKFLRRGRAAAWLQNKLHSTLVVAATPNISPN